MQFQSDILGVPVERPKVIETTAMGAAYLAGLAVGFWKDQSMIAQRRKIDRRFNPMMSEDKRKALYDGWKKAVKRAMKWEEE
jgi:glycerol kinase